MRRAERVNYRNLIVKFSEMNLCRKEHLEKFDSMVFQKKILLLAEPHSDIKNGIVVNKYTRNHEVSNDTLYYDKFIDLTDFINSGFDD